MSELFNTLGAWPHILQSEPWAAFKARWGWRRVDAPSGVSLIARTIRPLPFPILYAPKGPNIVWQDEGAREQTLSALENLARAHRALFVKIDPDVPAAQNAVRDALTRRGWRFSPEQIQYRNTFLLDLRPGEDDLLAGMKPKWRYNIRLAERKSIAVRLFAEDAGEHLAEFYALYAETAARDRFLIRPFAYYQDVWSDFLRRGMAALLLAYHEDTAIAGLMLFICGRRAWYFYGASSGAHRELMPNHLLQWRAIQQARALGCEVYDFWGAPDTIDESDPLWGVARFKAGFGAPLFEGLGAWDYAPSRARYGLYTRLMPKVIALMKQRHGRQER